MEIVGQTSVVNEMDDTLTSRTPDNTCHRHRRCYYDRCAAMLISIAYFQRFSSCEPQELGGC